MAAENRQLYAAKLANKCNTFIENNVANLAVEYNSIRDLSTLAVIMGDGSMQGCLFPPAFVPLPSDFQANMYSEISKQVKWKPPLPKTMRRAHQQMIASQSRAEMQPGGNLVRNTAASFSTYQLELLKLQFRSHIQLLTQIYLLARVRIDEQTSRRAFESLERFVLFLGKKVKERGNIMLSKFDSNSQFGSAQVELFQIFADVSGMFESLPQKLRFGASSIESMKFPDNANQRKLWYSLKSAPFFRYIAYFWMHFDEEFEPNNPSFHKTSQAKFTPTEDALLAWGIRK